MNIKCLSEMCINNENGECTYDEVRIIKGICEGYVQKELESVELE